MAIQFLKYINLATGKTLLEATVYILPTFFFFYMFTLMVYLFIFYTTVLNVTKTAYRR